VIARDLVTNDVICDLSPDIISLTVNKAYRMAAGTFQLVVTYREVDGNRYDQMLTPDDMITIELDAGDGSGFKYVLTGLIDRIARTFRVAHNGAPERRITISGRDMGKLLTTIELGWDISGINRLQYPDGTNMITAAMFKRFMNSRGTPEELVTYIYQLFETQIPGADYVRHFNLKVDTDDDWQLYSPEMIGIQGTDTWSAMKRVENQPYNTLTTATNPTTGKFWIILEKTPIDKDGRLSRESLHEIGISEVVASDIGISDAERINLLCLYPPSTEALTNAVLDIALAYADLTRLNKASVQVHGVRPHVIRTHFVPRSFWMTNKDTLQDVTASIERSKLFWEWYLKNETFESGYFSIHGNPGIQQGDGLLYTDGKKEFFIEQVTHIYSVYPAPQFITQLHVTRGQDVRR
jgi:hypothetical protein